MAKIAPRAKCIAVPRTTAAAPGGATIVPSMRTMSIRGIPIIGPM
jgi:DNA polymerase III alpha subunit (gram-positive type)